jgi:hypothetical protein
MQIADQGEAKISIGSYFPLLPLSLTAGSFPLMLTVARKDLSSLSVKENSLAYPYP